MFGAVEVKAPPLRQVHQGLLHLMELMAPKSTPRTRRQSSQVAIINTEWKIDSFQNLLEGNPARWRQET